MGPEKILPRHCPDYCPYFWAALHLYCPARCSSVLSSQHLFLVSSGRKSWHLLLTLRWLSSPSSVQSSSFLWPLLPECAECGQLPFTRSGAAAISSAHEARITSSCWVVTISCPCWAVPLNTVQLLLFELTCSLVCFMQPPGSISILDSTAVVSQPLHCCPWFLVLQIVPWSPSPGLLLPVFSPDLQSCRQSPERSCLCHGPPGWFSISGWPTAQPPDGLRLCCQPPSHPLGHYSLCWPLQHFLLPCQPLEHFGPRCHPPGQYHSPVPPPHPPAPLHKAGSPFPTVLAPNSAQW